MRKLIVRLVLITLYIVASLLNLIVLPKGYDFWSCGLAAAFAIAVVIFSGRASFFVLIPVFITTCLIPAAALTAMIRPNYDSWHDSFIGLISEMSTSNPLNGFELLLPLVTAAICLIIATRWLGPNNSFKPNPQQGGA